MSGPSRRTALKAIVGLGLASGLADCTPAQEVQPPGPGGGPGADPDATGTRPAGGGGDASGTPAGQSGREGAAGEAASENAGLPVEEHDHPIAGDRLVFAFGSREGDMITPADVPTDATPLLAYPADPGGAHVADGRLDQVILVRIDPSTMTDETRARSVDGIVAYSGICTHNGCEVTEWDSGTKTLLCPCHDSFFDPRDGAAVLDGPAPQRLAALPLQLRDGVLVAAGGFVGRVGFQRR